MALLLPQLKERALADRPPVDILLQDWSDSAAFPSVADLEERIGDLLRREGVLPYRKTVERLPGLAEPIPKTLFYRPAERLLLEALGEPHPIILASTLEVQRYVDALQSFADDPENPRELWIWRGASGESEIERIDGLSDPRFALSTGFTSQFLEDSESPPERQLEIIEHLRLRSMLDGHRFGSIRLDGNEVEYWWREAEEEGQALTPLGLISLNEPEIQVVVNDARADLPPELRPDVVHLIRLAIGDDLRARRDDYPQFAQKRPVKSFGDLMFRITRFPDGAVIVIPDAHHFINFDPSSPVGAMALQAIAALKDAYHRLQRRGSRTKLVLLCGELSLPKDLREEVQRVDLPLPGRPELYVTIQRALGGSTRDEELLVALSDEAAGMTLAETEAVILRTPVGERNDLVAKLLTTLRQAKQRHIARSPALELVETASASDLGGMERFNAWLDRRQAAFNEPERARSIGINRPPKGVLLLGIPGSGKSLAAKVIARGWSRRTSAGDKRSAPGLPLVRLDMGAIQDRWVGSSEARVREALRVIEAMSPCVLWIDEIDKSVSQESHSHSGEMNVRATLLTWMQESRHPVFIVATANRFAALPPELTRAGRFDARFFFGCPGAAGRRRILEIHLSQRGYEPSSFALGRLADTMHGFTGAEIEQVVLDSLYEAFERDVPLSDELLSRHASGTQPLVRSAGKSLDELWDLIEDGRVELASEAMLTRTQVAKLIDPELYRPIYCRGEKIEGFEKLSSRADRLLMATPFGGPAAIVMDSGEKEWIFVQTNFRQEQSDPGYFKFLDTLKAFELNFVFDTLVSEHGLDTVYFETEELRKRFENSDMLSAYQDFYKSLDEAKGGN